MFCTKCGNKFDKNVKYCPKCGVSHTDDKSGSKYVKKAKLGKGKMLFIASSVIITAVITVVVIVFIFNPRNMILIPAGEFIMGCNDSIDNTCMFSTDSRYSKKSLKAYYIDKYEVTVNQYIKCVNEKKCEKPEEYGDSNWAKSDRKNHPINWVNWYQSNSYCEWAGKRLPTEAEWEKAARGTDGRIYPWGNEIATCEYAVMDDGGNGCGKDSTWPVGSKPKGASPYGVMDMAGNVREWVKDESGGGYRIYRGGDLTGKSLYQRVVHREGNIPMQIDGALGFRCVSNANTGSIMSWLRQDGGGDKIIGDDFKRPDEKNNVKQEQEMEIKKAKIIISSIGTTEEAYRAEHGKYSSNLEELGADLNKISNNKVYKDIKINLLPNCFEVIVSGNLDNDPDLDIWKYDCNRNITHIQDDLSN